MRRSILIAHPWMESGGSEATTMWAVQALQDGYRVAIVTAGTIDFDFLNRTYGCRVDAHKVRVIQAPVLPGVKSGTRLVALQHGLFHRYCRSIARKYDVCISGYNFVPFGKPSIQLVGDFSFDEELRKIFYVHEDQKFVHKTTFVRTLYLLAGKILSGRKNPFSNKDVNLANSKWTAGMLQQYLDLECDVLYPPVKMFGTARKTRGRKSAGFAYIGRIAPEKEVEKIITTLEKVRERGFLVTLDLAGNRGASSYEVKVRQMAEARCWVNDIGYVSGSAKEKILSANTFGIQACRCEAFGIATAEMASRGCIPFVPSDCGPAEIVQIPDLQFSSQDDAVEKIANLLSRPETIDVIREKVISDSQQFNSREFVVNLRRIVESMCPDKKRVRVAAHVSKKKGRTAHH